MHHCKLCNAEFEKSCRGAKLYCSETCRAKTYAVVHAEKRREKALQYYYDNREKQLANSKAYQKRFRDEYVNPEAQRVVNMFNLLSEEDRPGYAAWLSFLADADYREFRVVNHWNVEEWIARYAPV